MAYCSNEPCEETFNKSFIKNNFSKKFHQKQLFKKVASKPRKSPTERFSDK